MIVVVPPPPPPSTGPSGAVIAFSVAGGSFLLLLLIILFIVAGGVYSYRTNFAFKIKVDEFIAKMRKLDKPEEVPLLSYDEAFEEQGTDFYPDERYA